MVEMVEILDGRLGKHTVERVRYVINNLLHLVIVKYLVILHADPCNKSYVCMLYLDGNDRGKRTSFTVHPP